MPTLPPTDHTPQPYTGPDIDTIIAKRTKHVHPVIFRYYPNNPLMVVEGHMQYVWDEKGNRYLDTFGGICTVGTGHCHPEITEALIEQAKKIHHSPTVYLHPEVAQFAEELAATFPDPLNRVYFVNSGSEANDLAVLMARLHTGYHDMIALRNGYHGGNAIGMALTSHNTWKYPIALHQGIKHAKAPHPIYGEYSYDDPDAGEKYAAEIENLIQYGTAGKIAGYIAEPIQGVGGAVPYPTDYLGRAYEHTRAAGGVCIADEVQSGFGRTGTNFWGFQNYGVQPDIVTMAKSIGNGFPLAAVVTTDEIAQSMVGKIHFNTYGGDPLAMVVGRKNLEILQRPAFQENIRKVGEIILTGLRELQKKFPHIASVRGSGLIIGYEFIANPGEANPRPGTEICAHLFDEARNHGLLLGKGGLFGSAIRIKPPMCMTEADAHYMLEVIDMILTKKLG